MYLVPPISYSRTVTGGEVVGLSVALFMVIPPFCGYSHIALMLFAYAIRKYKPLRCNGYGPVCIFADVSRSYNVWVQMDLSG